MSCELIPPQQIATDKNMTSTNNVSTLSKSLSFSEKQNIAVRIIQSEFYYLDETSIISVLNDISIFGKCSSKYSIEDFVSQWYSNCNFDIAA
jgi:hypothetical protein